MIKSLHDYRRYRKADLLINGKFKLSRKEKMKDLLFPEPNMLFLKALRKYEYHLNTSGIMHKLLLVFYYIRFRRISHKTGISIPKNVFGEGLALPHFGSIVINASTKVGKNCMIHVGVNIGTNGGSSISPIIGDNVYIGPGAKIFGEITIADNCYIGANSVVNKSVTEPNSVVVGSPAKVVKKESQAWWVKNRIEV
jgi:serine O-acetyltransferase